MLINIENVQIRVELSSEKFELPLKFKQEIEKFWDKASKENTNKKFYRKYIKSNDLVSLKKEN